MNEEAFNDSQQTTCAFPLIHPLLLLHVPGVGYEKTFLLRTASLVSYTWVARYPEEDRVS